MKFLVEFLDILDIAIATSPHSIYISRKSMLESNSYEENVYLIRECLFEIERKKQKKKKKNSVISLFQGDN